MIRCTTRALILQVIVCASLFFAAGRVLAVAPVISYVSPEDPASLWTQRTLYPCATVTDADGDLETVEFLVGTTALQVEQYGDWYGSQWSPETEGDYVITIRATDEAQNITEHTINVSVDNPPPALDIMAPISGGSTHYVQPISAHVTDYNGSVAGVYYAIQAPGEGEPVYPADYESLPFDYGEVYTSNDWIPTATGSYTVYFHAVDDEGGFSDDSSTVEIGNPPPEITITDPPESYTGSVHVILPLGATITDANSGLNVNSITCTVTKGEETWHPTLHQPQTGSWYLFDWTPAATGTYTATFSATDLDGASNSASREFTIDNPPPTVTIFHPLPNAYPAYRTHEGITIWAEVTDNNGGIQAGSVKCTVLRGETVVYGPEVMTPGENNQYWHTGFIPDIEAQYRVVVEGKDIDNALTSAYVDFFVDNPPPFATIQSPYNGMTVGSHSDIPFEVMASDDQLLTADDLELQFNDGTPVPDMDLPWTWDQTAGVWRCTWLDVPAGVYYLQIKATDYDGESSYSQCITLTVVDLQVDLQVSGLPAENEEDPGGFIGVFPRGDLVPVTLAFTPFLPSCNTVTISADANVRLWADPMMTEPFPTTLTYGGGTNPPGMFWVEGVSTSDLRGVTLRAEYKKDQTLISSDTIKFTVLTMAFPNNNEVYIPLGEPKTITPTVTPAGAAAAVESYQPDDPYTVSATRGTNGECLLVGLTPGSTTVRAKINGIVVGYFQVTVVSVNLQRAGLTDEQEEDPGMFVGVNDDDDNFDQVPDNAPGQTTFYDDDILAVTMSLSPVCLQAGTLDLTVEGDNGNVRLWVFDPVLGERIPAPSSWDADTYPLPEILVEGLQTSGLRAISLKLEYKVGAEVICDDVIKVTVAKVDFGVEDLYIGVGQDKSITSTVSPAGIPVSYQVMDGNLLQIVGTQGGQITVRGLSPGSTILLAKVGEVIVGRVMVYVVGVNLQVQALDEAAEEMPGAIIGVGSMPGSAIITLNPTYLPAGKVTLACTNAKLTVSENWDGSNPFIGPGVADHKDWIIGQDTVPSSIYVTGVDASDTMRDTELTMTFEIGDVTVTDTVKCTLVQPNVTIQQLTEEMEEDPGAFIGLGGLVAMTISYEPADLNISSFSLSLPPQLSAWEDAGKGTPLSIYSWDLSTEQPPETIYLEGVMPSQYLRDMTVSLNYFYQGAYASDYVNVTVFSLSLSSNKDVIAAGAKNTEAHKCNITATVTPSAVSGSVSFDITQRKEGVGQDADANCSPPQVDLTNGSATTELRSSNLITPDNNKAVIQATFISIIGSPNTTISISFGAGEEAWDVTPSVIYCDGVSTADIWLRLTNGVDNIDQHRLQWSIVRIEDADGVEVYNADTGKDLRAPGDNYGSILTPISYSGSNGNGWTKTTYQAGYLPGIITFQALDLDVYEDQ